jgi:hypothetical protein
LIKRGWRRRLNRRRPGRRVVLGIRANRRSARGFQKRCSPNRSDHDDQKQGKSAPPTEACPATFSVRPDRCADLFGAQDINEAQKPFFPVRARGLWCLGRAVIQSRSAVHPARLLHLRPHPNRPPRGFRVRDRTARFVRNYSIGAPARECRPTRAHEVLEHTVTYSHRGRGNTPCHVHGQTRRRNWRQSRS